MWTGTFWEQFAQDIRYGLRAMAANKLFTAMAVLSLALGIGANTAIYSFMDAIMVRALPVRIPSELVDRQLARQGRLRAWSIPSSGSGYDEPGGTNTSPNFPFQPTKSCARATPSSPPCSPTPSAGRSTSSSERQAELLTANSSPAVLQRTRRHARRRPSDQP